MFAVDIIVNFRSAFINQKTGEEVMTAKAVAVYYLKNRFVIDLIATIPFDFIMSLVMDT